MANRTAEIYDLTDYRQVKRATAAVIIAVHRSKSDREH